MLIIIKLLLLKLLGISNINMGLFLQILVLVFMCPCENATFPAIYLTLWTENVQ